MQKSFQLELFGAWKKNVCVFLFSILSCLVDLAWQIFNLAELCCGFLLQKFSTGVLRTFSVFSTTSPSTSTNTRTLTWLINRRRQRHPEQSLFKRPLRQHLMFASNPVSLSDSHPLLSRNHQLYKAVAVPHLHILLRILSLISRLIIPTATASLTSHLTRKHPHSRLFSAVYSVAGNHYLGSSSLFLKLEILALVHISSDITAGLK